MTHPAALPDDPICPNCHESVHVRNPTGRCDHLYWPEMLTAEAKALIGDSELERIRGECWREMGRAMKPNQKEAI